jgi:hypothetical protein
VKYRRLKNVHAYRVYSGFMGACCKAGCWLASMGGVGLLTFLPGLVNFESFDKPPARVGVADGFVLRFFGKCVII